MAQQRVEELATVVVNAGYHLHRDVGPGLLELVYHAILFDRLLDAGLQVESERSVDIQIDGKTYANAFKADLIVENLLLIELKSVERMAPVHVKQTLTYIRVLNLPLGLLINVGAARYREGIKRIMNDHAPQ